MNFLELNLQKIASLAEVKEEENFRFRSFLKKSDVKKTDRIVHNINERVSSQIDCTACANCCITSAINMDEEDIKTLSSFLGITEDEFEKQYTTKDEFGDITFEKAPCAFLKDKKCTVYEVRPKACREYPHLHKEEFTTRLFGVISNCSVCPIVFNVFEKLKDEMNFSRRR